jgi:hypothetical protein
MSGWVGADANFVEAFAHDDAIVDDNATDGGRTGRLAGLEGQLQCAAHKEIIGVCVVLSNRQMVNLTFDDRVNVMNEALALYRGFAVANTP